MVKKGCFRKPQPNTDLTAMKNDLVLSSDRCQISLGSNRIGSLEKHLPVAKSLVADKIDQKEVTCIAGKIDRVRDDDDDSDDKEYPRTINQNETYSVDGNSDKLTSFYVNDENSRTRHSLSHSTCLCSSQSSFHSNYPAESLLGISDVNDAAAAAQKIPVQGQGYSVVNQDFDRSLCGPTFNKCDTFNSEIGWNLSDKADWLSPDSSCQIDMVLDQLFEESLREKQDRINNSLHLPQNMQDISENDTSENMYQAEFKLDFTVESCTPDLKPSVRGKGCTISNSNNSKSRNVKLDGHNIKRPALSAITRGDYSKVYVKTSRCYDSDTYNHTCRRKGKNSFLYLKREDVPTYLINHTTDSGSVGDLQPSVRVRKQSLCQKRESTLQKSSADNNRNELNSDEDQAVDAEKCLKETDTNTAEIVDSEVLGEYNMSENVCNERDNSENVQGIVKRRNKSFRKQGPRVNSGTLVDNINAQDSYSIEVSNRRRFSKSLEESDCHGNNSSEYQEQLYLKRDKEETNSQSETKLSNTSQNLIDRKNGALSVENVSESHRYKNSGPFVLSVSETKRKRFNSGPGSSIKRAKSASGDFVLDTPENLSIKNKFSWERNRVKLKNKYRCKIRVSKDKTEHTVIHDIHKTIAESSNVGSKVAVRELNEAGDTETVRVADLENIIPLEVLSCDNVRKRKVRLKQEKAKGALYRQVSGDGIWRSVNSKY